MDYQVNKNTIIGDILDKDGDVAPFFLEIWNALSRLSGFKR